MLTIDQRIELLRIAAAGPPLDVKERIFAMLDHDRPEEAEPMPHIKVPLYTVQQAQDAEIKAHLQRTHDALRQQRLKKPLQPPAEMVRKAQEDMDKPNALLERFDAETHAAEMAAVHDALGLEEVMREAVHALLQDGEAWLYVREDVDRLRAAVVSRDQVFHAAAPLTPFGEAQRKARQQATAARQDKAYAACVAQFNATREPT